MNQEQELCKCCFCTGKKIEFDRKNPENFLQDHISEKDPKSNFFWNYILDNGHFEVYALDKPGCVQSRQIMHFDILTPK